MIYPRGLSEAGFRHTSSSWENVVDKTKSLVSGLVLMAAGSGFHSPSLSALISREAGRQQGSVLGVSQSLGALGRICGPLLGTFTFRLGTSVPYLTAAGCMGVGLLLAILLVQPAPAGRLGPDS